MQSRSYRNSFAILRGGNSCALLPGIQGNSSCAFCQLWSRRSSFACSLNFSACPIQLCLPLYSAASPVPLSQISHRFLADFGPLFQSFPHLRSEQATYPRSQAKKPSTPRKTGSLKTPSCHEVTVRPLKEGELKCLTPPLLRSKIRS